VLALVLGGLIGLEREWRGHPAGMRTHILVCVGAALITLSSIQIGTGLAGPYHGDPGHIAAQIVSGVGFLGAGAIIREGITIHGLTTAASIWATAGIGITIGAGPRMGELAVIATAIGLLTLSVLNRLEDFINVRQHVCRLEIEVEEADHGPARVLALLAENGILVYGQQSEPGKGAGLDGAMRLTRRMSLRVRLPKTFDRAKLNTLLTEEPGVTAFHLE